MHFLLDTGWLGAYWERNVGVLLCLVALCDALVTYLLCTQALSSDSVDRLVQDKWRQITNGSVVRMQVLSTWM